MLIYWLYKSYPLPQSLISKYKEIINWEVLSGNQNITWTDDLINQYANKLDWANAICKNPSMPWSIDFIVKNLGKTLSKNEISGNRGIPWSYDLINRFKEQWNWHWLVANESIQWTERMFVDFNLFKFHISLVNGPNLWNIDFILKYKERFNWWDLSRNPYLPWSEDLIGQLKTTWAKEKKRKNSPWMGLSENTGIPWTKSLINKYNPIPILKPIGFSWKGLSRNESLPWDKNIIEDYVGKWDWELLSINNGVGFSKAQLEKYSNKIKWKRSSDFDLDTIASNTSLPWSEEIIDKFNDKWDWNGIARNTGIPWSEKLMKKYSAMLLPSVLFHNPSLPWTIDFILKYEENCFEVWDLTWLSEDIGIKLWSLIFQPLLTDSLVDEILFIESKKDIRVHNRIEADAEMPWMQKENNLTNTSVNMDNSQINTTDENDTLTNYEKKDFERKIEEKDVKQGVANFYSTFRSKFTKPQKEAILSGMILLATTSPTSFTKNKQDAFYNIVNLLDYKLPNLEDYCYLSANLGNERIFSLLNSLEESDKEWFIVVILTMLYTDGKPSPGELHCGEVLCQEMKISSAQVEEAANKMEKVNAIRRRYNF
ncbi:hypothetical protein D4R20_01330 [bacterium]|nr:MAG: hypothetical protein D4R20_01330 [bacterium]